MDSFEKESICTDDLPGLLNDRVFIDYLNVFLSLPVSLNTLYCFGHKQIYKNTNKREREKKNYMFLKFINNKFI